MTVTQTTTPTTSVAVADPADQALKAKHAAMWASGDYPRVADEVVGSLGGRLIDAEAWEACTLFDVNYRPERMTVAELEQGFRDLARRIYDTGFIEQRRRRFFARQTQRRRGAN